MKRALVALTPMLGSLVFFLGCAGDNVRASRESSSAGAIVTLVRESDMVSLSDLRNVSIIDRSFRLSNWGGTGKGLSQYKIIRVVIPPAVEAPPKDHVILFMRRIASGAELISWQSATTDNMKVLRAELASGGEGSQEGDAYRGEGCLVTNCHTALRSIKLAHAPVRDRLCSACHHQISTNHPEGRGVEFALARRNTTDLCMQCHEAFKSEFQAATVIHAPVADGRCGVCHDPHGTDFPVLLLKVTWRSEWEWPYGPPEIEVTKLCWQCHDRKMITEDRSTTATGFRDGNRNLHSFHVNYPKGRKCKACHETHYGRHEKLFRDSVPFGTAGWKLPIDITLNKHGGSCVVGCHHPRSYSRIVELQRGQ